MAWITFADDADFLNACASPEMEALRTAATGVDQADPLAAMAAAIVSEVRGYVATAPRNSLGGAGTIPEELKAAALDVFRFRATLRLPGVKMLQDDSRRLAYSNAINLFIMVAEGRFAVEQPETPIEIETGSVPNPETGDVREEFARAEFDGL